MKIVDLFYSVNSGLQHQGIFRVSGSQVEINNFKDAFERGEDPLADTNDASDINSVAGVLKLYLRELREPLFPIVYFEQFMELARKLYIFRLIYITVFLISMFIYISTFTLPCVISLYCYFRTGVQTFICSQDA